MIFVDTCFFLALALKDDHLHQHALAWKPFLRGRFITTDFVLLEVADKLSIPKLRGFVSTAFTLAKSPPRFTVVPVSEELMSRGYELFQARPDKAWGLTDCISFCLMKERGVTEALTHDRHFEQAGFKAMLRHDPSAN